MNIGTLIIVDFCLGDRQFGSTCNLELKPKAALYRAALGFK